MAYKIQDLRHSLSELSAHFGILIAVAITLQLLDFLTIKVFPLDALSGWLGLLTIAGGVVPAITLFFASVYRFRVESIILCFITLYFAFSEFHYWFTRYALDVPNDIKLGSVGTAFVWAEFSVYGVVTALAFRCGRHVWRSSLQQVN